jgi:hypothetical protein
LNPESDQAVCEGATADSSVQRLCACKAKGSGRDRRAEEGAERKEEETRQEEEDVNSAIVGNAAEQPTIVDATHGSANVTSNHPATSTARSNGPDGTAVQYMVGGALASALFGVSSGGAGGGAATSVAAAAAMVLTLAVLPAPTAAHNWLHTPSRSRLKASTTMPCIGRKASDTHQQVGPGQDFMMKWATGHASDGNLGCMGPIEDPADPLCIPTGKEFVACVSVSN